MPTRTLALFACLACLLPGCVNDRPAVDASQTSWVPSSAISLATIRRDTTIALRRAETTDTLVFEESNYNTHGVPGARRTWFVQIPSDMPAGEVVRFDKDDENVIAWYREEAGGRPAHAVRASGSIRVHGQSDTGIDATVVLRATAGAPGPGDVVYPVVNATRRGIWVYDAPGAPVTPAIDPGNL